MPYQSLWKAADLPYNYITAGNRLGTLKSSYQQYGEPPGQTSIDVGASCASFASASQAKAHSLRCPSSSHKTEWFCGNPERRATTRRRMRSPSRRAIQPASGQPWQAAQQRLCSGPIMRHQARPARKTGGAALGLKAVETLGTLPVILLAGSNSVLFPISSGGEDKYDED